MWVSNCKPFKQLSLDGGVHVATVVVIAMIPMASMLVMNTVARVVAVLFGKTAVVSDDGALDVTDDVSDVDCRDGDGDDCDDTDDGDCGDGGDDDDDHVGGDENGDDGVGDDDGGDDDDGDDDDDGCVLIVYRLSPWYRSCGFRQVFDGSLVEFLAL